MEFTSHLDLGNGDFYVGETAKGRPHGRGVKVFLSWNPPVIREAWYKEGDATGRGRMIGENGNIYIGEYLNDKKHGHGTYKWPSGTSYTGEFKNG